LVLGVPTSTLHRAWLLIRRRTNWQYRFINNEFVKGVDGKTFEVINPSNEKVICSVHEATEKDVDIAVAAARKAFNGAWKHVTPEQRGKYLYKLAELMERDVDLLSAVESLDNGKAFALAKGDLSLATSCIRYYAGWCDKIEGKVLDMNPDTFTYTRQEPVSSSITIFE
jgi:aldehyde dehydrogenase (NAD+)